MDATAAIPVNAYVRDDILGTANLPRDGNGFVERLAGHWQPNNNHADRVYTRIFRRSCGQYHPPNTPVAAQQIVVTLRMGVDDVSQATHKARLQDAVGSGYKIPQRLKQYLDAGALRKHRAAVVHCTIYWKHATDPYFDSSHATAIVLDFVRRVQIFYDPAATRDSSYVSAFCSAEPLYPGFKVMSANQLLDVGASLQGRVQGRLAGDHPGVCTTLTGLMLLVTARFNYYNPRVIARKLADTLVVGDRSNELVSWWKMVVERPTAAQMDALLFPSSQANRCKVVSTSTGRVCSRKSCRNGPLRSMCWQHRYLTLNRDAPNGKCGTAQYTCV